MKRIALLTLTLCLPAFADTIRWEYSEDTGGENVHWISPNPVDPNANQYEFVSEITYVAVDVVFLGAVIGPNDITGDIDPEFLFKAGVLEGPAPVTMMNEPLQTDADDDGDIDMSADFHMFINGKGYGQFDVTNIFLGDVYVDTGWPFGWQYVDLDHVYMNGYMDITPVIIECPEDVNGDSVVNVTDLLTAVGNWGESGEGDVDGSGVVDVSDVLAIVNAWGSCPS